ncbi:MAG: glycosyltransferase family 9 protein [Burkholderiaceae bacterium]|nr:glycosyltransferase family 9 protein [Burkholderiaceae bacterium]
MPPPADPSHKRVERVERIAVLRPSAIGDFVFALPALAALRAAYPQAHIVYLGRRWHREFLEDRPGPVDETLEVPPIPGVGAPLDLVGNATLIDAFVETLRERRFDLALQWYGGGGYANPFLQRLGARCTAGLRAEGAAPLDRWLAYEQWRNERLRLLEAALLVGAAPTELASRLTVTARDREQLRRHWQPPGAPIAVLQPGATDPRRRWPAERFAAIGDALADAGASVAVNGSADERALVAQVTDAMRAPATNLCDLPLGALVALLECARVLVSNDTGPLHLADALGTPSVGIYWLPNLLAAQPLVADAHRFAFSMQTDCPVCGLPNVRVRCAHETSYVDRVSVDEVRALALERFNCARPASGRAPAPT